VVIVDTSVWIDFFNGKESHQVASLETMIDQTRPVGLTDIVLTELLQGCATEREARELEQHLLAFLVLRLENLADFTAAAELFRKARDSGLNIKSGDCLIAVPCIRTGASLLHADKDFDLLAECTPLKIWNG
jgi:predicted nucleic acid-binding protein